MSDSIPRIDDFGALTAYNKKQAYSGHCDLLVKKDFTAIDKYYAEPYIQHNQRLVNGLESLREFKTANVPGARTTVLRCFADRDLVFFQEMVEGIGPQPLDFWDIYRVEEGKIVEHWDIHQISTGPHHISGHTLFDGVVESSNIASTEWTRALILKLISNVFICRKYEEIGLYVSPVSIQHAAGIGDGIESWTQYLKMAQWFTGDIQYDAIRKLIVEGDFAVTACQGTLGGEPHHFWDMWRVEKGKVVEHWNVTSRIENSRDNRNPAI